jgi:hypothetical protein
MTEVKDLNKLKVAKFKCLQSFLFFTRYIFKHRNGRKYVVAEPHQIIASVMERVFRGELTKVIINVAPRYGKTELAVKYAIAYGLALNASAKFIHLTYSKSLALDNSEEAKEIVESEAYQQLFNVKIKKDSKSKEKWYTTEGGGVYAAAAGGQVTGFGAGRMDEEENTDTIDGNTLDEFITSIENKEGFGGAIILDDTIKPDDAFSEIKRNRVNDRFETTIRNRVNSRKTPIIVMAQRLHKDDLCGRLMELEPGEWTVITLKALKDDGTALFPMKHTVDELLQLRRINEYVFDSQYQQEPPAIRRGGEFLYNFLYKNHVKPIQYDRSLPVHISLDSNVYPYIAVSVWQIVRGGHKIKIRQIHELPAIEPENSASAAGRKIATWLKNIGYTERVFMYGDRSTKSRNNIDDDKRSFFQIVTENIINAGFRVEDKILNAPPSVSSVCDFVNAVLSGEMDFAQIEISDKCLTSITDYQQTKKDENGSMLKVRVRHPTVEGATYEKNGHLTDTFKDFIVQAFYSNYVAYVSKNGQLKPGGITQISRGPGASGQFTF